MRIYFQDITFSSKPVLWAYPKLATSAQCLYLIAGTKEKVDVDELNSYLKGIPGIQIEGGIAKITDINEFRKAHSFNVAVAPEDQHRVNPETSSSFFRSTRPAESTFASSSTHFVLDKHTAISASARSLTFKPLSLEVLLKDYPGETLVYEVDLPGNNAVNLERLAALKVYSPTAVNLAAQVIKNADYYFLRSIQMRLIRELFEEVIIPSLASFNGGAPIPAHASRFFTEAIRSIMKNSRYNSRDTAYEIAYDEENEPIPVKDNFEVRKQYSRTMLAAFLYFINDSSAPVGSGNPELAEWLHKFKEYVQIHKPKIESLLLQLELLIICTGLMDHDYKKMLITTYLQGSHLDFSLLLTRIKALQMGPTTLNMALSQLKIEHRIDHDKSVSLPTKLYSLRHMVKNCLLSLMTETPKRELTPKDLELEIDDIIQNVLPAFMDSTKGNKSCDEARWISNTIKSIDNDLYFCEPWQEMLGEEFKSICNKLASVHNDTKHMEKWKEKIVNAVVDLLHSQMKHLPRTQIENPMPGSTLSMT